MKLLNVGKITPIAVLKNVSSTDILTICFYDATLIGKRDGSSWYQFTDYALKNFLKDNFPEVLSCD